MQQKKNWQADTNGIKYVLNAVRNLIQGVPKKFGKFGKLFFGDEKKRQII